MDILKRHFVGEISTEDAVNNLVEKTGGILEDSSRGIAVDSLYSFPKRHHVEFHPCDACNLCCRGCTYSQDTSFRPEAVSYPFDQLIKIFSLIQPDAITIAGGGEPALYRSGKYRLGDLICALGNGDFGCSPAIGLITNGIVWPQGNQDWHQYVDWVRYSLDASSPQSYVRSKGKNYFNRVIGNILRSLTETNIPQVGVGFVYHPGNIAEAGNIISFFANLIMQRCPNELHRFNIQFRPWRSPLGKPMITERILSSEDVENACAILFRNIDQDKFLERFVRENTNIAVNLLCGGAREMVHPFSECYFGLAKTVIRADGSLYPCFRTAASRDPLFYLGNIIADTPQRIALRELYVTTTSTKKICAPNHERCLLCVFNNLLEKGIESKHRPMPDIIEDYFF
jgi:radical SAM protein with 4Fe4S-binding SPASM domain